MSGPFQSIDLMVKGEASGHRGECLSNLLVYNSDEDIRDMYFIPIESDGDTIFDTYTINHTFISTFGRMQYAYKLAVYRQYAKLGDTGTANGVGELVTGSTYSSGALVGNRSVRNTPPLKDPIVLLQGSYFIAMHIYTITAEIGDAVTVFAVDGIDAGLAGNTWVNESHIWGIVGMGAGIGAIPTIMTTFGGNMLALGGTFANSQPSFWAGIFDARNAYP